VFRRLLDPTAEIAGYSPASGDKPSPKPVLIDVREHTDGSLAGNGTELNYRAIGLALVYEGERSPCAPYFDQPHQWSSVEEEYVYLF
jgi:hypothetical protein